MKALYAASPNDYGLAERPKPTPAPGEVLVRVARAALCHTDVIIREGVAGHTVYPFIPGHEFSGVVEECGLGVKHLQPGDHVAVHTIYACGECLACRSGDSLSCDYRDEMGSSLDGGFAEFCAVNARLLFKLPDHVSLPEGALLEPLANAVSAVRQAKVRAGDKVVVIGPGPIGLLALQAARLSNPARLVLVGTRDERLALGKSLGASHVVNIKDAGADERLQAILEQEGADAVVECAGTPSALNLAIRIVGWRGRVAIEGVHDVEETIPISPYSLLERSASLIGVNGWVTADFAHALELMSNRLVDVKPLITHTFPLEEWETAFHMITKRKSEAIKVQFCFEQEVEPKEKGR
jgi:threonine dehydrogenase-like Zn-dependent dehydrogenase